MRANIRSFMPSHNRLRLCVHGVVAVPALGSPRAPWGRFPPFPATRHRSATRMAATVAGLSSRRPQAHARNRLRTVRPSWALERGEAHGGARRRHDLLQRARRLSEGAFPQHPRPVLSPGPRMAVRLNDGRFSALPAARNYCKLRVRPGQCFDKSRFNGRDDPMLKILLRASLVVLVVFGGAFAALA